MPTPFRGPLAQAFAPAREAASLEQLLCEPSLALPVPPATDRSVWDPDSGSVDRVTLSDVVARATAELGEPWPQPLARTAVRRYRDGDRAGHEALVFARTRRVTRAVVAAAALADDDARLDEAVDGLWLLCEHSSWCWPAHDDTRERHGAVVATVTDPFLDLGAGEVAAQLAWADQLLGPLLDDRWPGVRERLRHEVRTRVIEPFVRRRDWHWIGLDGHVHNWNPWIHGNVVVAALRLLDGEGDARLRADVVDLVIEGLDRYVASLPADGAVDEGFHYWWNGAARALEALDLLAHATGGALDGTAVPALRESVAFPHRVHLGGPWHLNVADGPARGSADASWSLLHRLARRAGDAEAVAHAASFRVPGSPSVGEGEGLGRVLRTVTDPLWTEAVPAGSPLPRDVWLPSVQVLVARSRAGSEAGLTVAFKGGHNGEHHNHLDVGSFVVASDGVPVVVDVGRPTYTAASFGPDRYSIWPMQSAWHNVPEVRGAGQGVGPEFAVREVSCVLDDGEARASAGLAGAYPGVGLRGWRREVSLLRGAAGGDATVQVSDAWDLEPWSGPGAEPPTVVRLLLAGTVRLEGSGAVVVPLDDATPLRLRWPDDVPVEPEVRELDDPMLADVWGPALTRLTLDVTVRRGVVVTAGQVRDE